MQSQTSGALFPIIWNWPWRNEKNYYKTMAPICNSQPAQKDILVNGTERCREIKEHKDGCTIIPALSHVIKKCVQSFLSTKMWPETWLKWVKIIWFLQGSHQLQIDHFLNNLPPKRKIEVWLSKTIGAKNSLLRRGVHPHPIQGWMQYSLQQWGQHLLHGLNWGPASWLQYPVSRWLNIQHIPLPQESPASAHSISHQTILWAP